MSVSILYYKLCAEKINSAQQTELITCWSNDLDDNKKLKIQKLKHQKDQLLSLAGLQLLKMGLNGYLKSPFSLKQLKFPEHSKPYLNHDIDFNISHSGDVACCVISDSIKVGIDIELQRKITPSTMKKFLPNKNLESQQNNKQYFFNLWTQNEAIIKAANSGSIFNMSDIRLEQNGGHYQDSFWYTYPIDIVTTHDNKEYTCHIACSEKIQSNDLDKINPKQIYNL